MPRPTPRRRLAALAVAAVALTAVLPAGTAQALPDWRTTPVRHDATRAHRALVTDLRWSRHAGFDRVVVDIRGRRPAYRTTFPKHLVFDPSGKPVPLKGRYNTYLVLRPSATFTLGGKNVYVGPRLARPRLESLRGIALVGSFEGVTTFGFTSRHRAYRVFTLTDPSRVVVDFRH